VFVSSWTLLAIERATFILTDGERISGTVVFHTDTRENLIDGSLNVGLGEGKEQNFHIEQVAVIDFIGGTPSRAELAGLPDSGHALVLRNGTTRLGQFVNMIGGDTLRWRGDNGSTENMPITQVSRVYLNPESARNIFNSGRRIGTGGRGRSAQSAQTLGQPAAGESMVRADTPWNDAGIDVRRGEVLSVSVRGRVMFGTDSSQSASQEGSEAMKSPSYPVPNLPVAGLIGKIGNGQPFWIGGNRNVSMPATGRLMLGLNDDHFPDNSGAFYVTITRGR
jgi:hypothetical protein